jgi:hypothetical protein
VQLIVITPNHNFQRSALPAFKVLLLSFSVAAAIFPVHAQITKLLMHNFCIALEGQVRLHHNIELLLYLS